MKRILPLIILVLCSVSVQAQQEYISTLYLQNQNNINVSYVGLTNCTVASLQHKQQYAGIPNSPDNYLGQIHTQLKPNHGIGASVNLWKAGLFTNNQVMVNYAYHKTIKENYGIHVGVSAGVNIHSFNNSEMVSFDGVDPNLNIYSGTRLNTGIGLMFTSPKFDVGMALPRVSMLNYNNSTNYNYNLNNTTLVHASYKAFVNEIYTVTPSVVCRNVHVNYRVIDFLIRTTYKNTFGLGIGYRNNSGLLSSIDFTPKEGVTIAYGYDFGMSNTANISKGSHEFMLKIKICKQEKNIIQEPKLDTQEIVDTISNDIVEIPSVLDTVKQVDQTIVKDEMVEEKNVDSKEEIKVPEEELKSTTDSVLETRREVDIVYFEFNSDRLTDESNKKIEVIIEELKKNTTIKVKLVGHTCDLGNSEINLVVGEKRANAIKNILLKRGVDSNRIEVYSEGENKPLVLNSSEENRVKNRRVEVILE